MRHDNFLMAFLYLLLFLFLFTAAYAGYKGAPWVPTRSADISQALAFVEGRSFRTAIDLGCGTGSLLFALAQRRSDLILHGYEVSLAPLLFAWIRKYFSPKRYKNIHLHWKNLYSVDVSSADLIFVFMMPEPHTRIAKTILHRAKKDALILFEAWAPTGFPPDRTLQNPGCLPLHIYSGSQFRT
jgi:SAM-dependent methyltransferase